MNNHSNQINQTEKKQDILILGIGNILLGDEGIGVHAVRFLEEKSWPVHIGFLDGGTGGFHLLSIFQQYKKIILIDATLDGNEPGRVSLLKPKYARDFPQTLSAHDIGLKDLVQSSALLGFLPEIYLITVSISDNQPLHMELSGDVTPSLAEIEEIVNDLIGKI
jgi:hydrogenase maturation protease